MARVEVPPGDGIEMHRLWALAPKMAGAVGALGDAIYVESSLPVRVREVARMRIAQINECDL